MTDWDKYLAITGIVIILLVVATSSSADEMTHKLCL